MAIIKLPKLGKSKANSASKGKGGGEDQIGFDVGEEYIDVQSGRRPLPGFKDALRIIGSLPVLLTATVLLFIAVGWLSAVGVEQANKESKYIEQSSQLLMLSQRVAKDAREAVYGQEGAFPTLKESRNNFESIINNLTKGNDKLGIPKSPTDVAPALKVVTDKWKVIRENVDQILVHAGDPLLHRLVPLREHNASGQHLAGEQGRRLSFGRLFGRLL